MASQSLISTVNGYENYIENKGKDEQVINAYVDACSVAINGEKDIEYGLQLTKRAKELIEDFCTAKTGGTIWDLEKYAFDHKTTYELINKKYEVLLLEAQNKIVDSYFQYIEKKREPKDRFYMPRRKQLIKIGLVDALQGMIDDKYDILCVSLVPGAGKSTIEKFFHSAVAGWFPKDYSLFYSHSGDITRMYYDGVYDIVTNDDDYAWHDIFPNLSVTSTNAKMEQFNIGKYKPFPSVQCTSVGSKNAGKVRASKFLLVADKSLEEVSQRLLISKTTTSRRVADIKEKIERSQAMINKVPIWEKVTLTIDEAAEYSNIGINRINDMLNNPSCPFVLFVGRGKRLVKRKEFEKYLEKTDSI